MIYTDKEIEELAHIEHEKIQIQKEILFIAGMIEKAKHDFGSTNLDSYEIAKCLIELGCRLKK